MTEGTVNYLTLEKLADEMRPFHNDICILHDCELVRLVGVHDGDDDFYYRVRGKRPHGEYLSTAVGHIVSLRGIYPAERYHHMDQVFALNGAEPTDEFVVTCYPSNRGCDESVW